MENKLPKIRQNLDLKQRSITGVRELKEFLYGKRNTLTQEEIRLMVDSTVEKAVEYAYSLGWEHRNDVYECRRAATKQRLVKAFNDFYNRNVDKLPVKAMEEVYYLYDIAMLTRYFNENLPLTRQIDRREIF